MILAQLENNKKFDYNKLKAVSFQEPNVKERYLDLKNGSPRFERVENCSFFIIFVCSHDAVFQMCRLEFRFQNLPFSKSAGKKCAVFV